MIIMLEMGLLEMTIWTTSTRDAAMTILSGALAIAL